MGIIIFKGMKLGFLPGDLTISLDNNNNKAVLSTYYNVTPIWLRNAKESLKIAKIASEKICSSWPENPESQKSLLLDELGSSMQVHISCGIALDTIYGILLPHSNVTSDLKKKWKENRTKRSAQVFEVLRLLYKFTNEESKQYKLCIDEIFTKRDKAVHPSSKLERSFYREDIDIGVDWKFAYYRYDSSLLCYKNTINILTYLWEKKCGNDDVNNILDNIIDSMLEMGLVVRK